MKIKAVITAFRLRTLPLALSSTIMASCLAYANNHFRLPVFILAALTTLFLQILSNLANDYGDSVKGVDNDKRLGPSRTVQSGLISLTAMRRLIMLFIILSFISGSALVLYGLKNIQQILIFYGVGVLAIISAVKYTVGRNPYGYVGFGDVFVFLFFGIVGVVGTYYLHVNSLGLMVFIPASALGLLSAAVLNLNNMRDIENDANSGKKTLVVRLGARGGKIYHAGIITFAVILLLIYTLIKYSGIKQYFVLFTIPLIIHHVYRVTVNTNPKQLDAELKKLAIFTFIISVIFGIGIVLL